MIRERLSTLRDTHHRGCLEVKVFQRLNGIKGIELRAEDGRDNAIVLFKSVRPSPVNPRTADLPLKLFRRALTATKPRMSGKDEMIVSIIVTWERMKENDLMLEWQMGN